MNSIIPFRARISIQTGIISLIIIGTAHAADNKIESLNYQINKEIAVVSDITRWDFSRIKPGRTWCVMLVHPDSTSGLVTVPGAWIDGKTGVVHGLDNGKPVNTFSGSCHVESILAGHLPNPPSWKYNWQIPYNISENGLSGREASLRDPLFLGTGGTGLVELPLMSIDDQGWADVSIIPRGWRDDVQLAWQVYQSSKFKDRGISDPNKWIAMGVLRQKLMNRGNADDELKKILGRHDRIFMAAAIAEIVLTLPATDIRDKIVVDLGRYCRSLPSEQLRRAIPIALGLKAALRLTDPPARNRVEPRSSIRYWCSAQLEALSRLLPSGYISSTNRDVQSLVFLLDLPYPTKL